MKQTYRIFGLNFLSEIELAAPLIQSEEYDAEIIFGTVHYPPPTFNSKGVCFYTLAGEVFFEIKDVARYHILQGSKIIVDPFPQADTDAIKLFLNGPVFGSLLLQKGFLPLHAAAFEYKGKAVLLAGNSGIGKSSTVAYLSQKGFHLIADDISSMKIVDGEVLLFSSGDYIKLWKDTIQKLRLETSGLKPARKKMEKYLFPVTSMDKVWNVDKIYLIKSHNRKELEFREMKGIERFVAIKENTYRKIFIKGLQIEKEYFSLAMNISIKVPIFEIIRPNFGFHVEELAETILKDLSKNE